MESTHRYINRIVYAENERKWQFLKRIITNEQRSTTTTKKMPHDNEPNERAGKKGKRKIYFTDIR